MPTHAASLTLVCVCLCCARNAGANETVQHGACLGLGLAAMGTAQEPIYEELKVTTTHHTLPTQDNISAL